MHLRKLMDLAVSLAAGGKKRRFLIGAVGVRADGVVVRSRNSPAINPTAMAHAEARLCKKLTPGSTVFVARVLRLDGTCAMAKPCESCQAILRASGISKVYYTTSKGVEVMEIR